MLKKVLLGIILCLTMVIGPVWAQDSAKISWDANPETDVSGYKIHTGTAPDVYDNTIDVGNVTIMDLDQELYPLGGTYYFAATAYDTAGLESDKSEVLTWDRIAASDPTGLFVEGGVLKWVASTSEDVKGYIVYYGPELDPYASNTDVGNVLEWDPSSVIVEDGTYFFSVAAYDTSPDANESGKSNAISIVKDTVPPTAPTNLKYVPIP
jgi:hypothetical protein